MACRENDSALYVTWKHAPPADWVDTVIWERVPLSEYYAVVEAEESAAALSVSSGEADTR
jgi:hypothetical protein